MSEKISQMTDGSPAQTGDRIPIDRSGANFTVTAASVAALAAGGSSQFFIGPGLMSFPTGVAGATIVRVDNEVRVWQFTLPVAVTVSKVTFSLNAAGGTPTVGIGIYNLAGNALIRASWTGGGTQQNTINVASTTLPAGTYWLAQSTDAAASTQVYTLSTPSLALIQGFNAVATRYGVATGVLAAGVMPATLGTITPDNTNTYGAMLAVFC